MHTTRAQICHIVSLSLVAGLITMPGAQAQVVQYSDRASFDAAATRLTTFDFLGTTDGADTKGYPNGLTLQGVTFSSSDGITASTIGFGYGGNANPPPGFGSGYIQTGSRLEIALPPGTTAFGTDVSELNNTQFFGGSLVAEINNSTTLLFSFPDMTQAFVGFTSTEPITSLSILDPVLGSSIAIDNVSYGPIPAAIPEMSSAISFGGTLLGLSLLVLSSRRKKAAPSVLGAFD